MEVGKQYVPRSVKQSTPMTCVYVTPNKNSLRTAVLQYPNGAEFAVEQGKWPFYMEYKEPLKISKKVLIYQTPEGIGVYAIATDALMLERAKNTGKYCGFPVLDIVDFEWTEKNV